MPKRSPGIESPNAGIASGLCVSRRMTGNKALLFVSLVARTEATLAHTKGEPEVLSTVYSGLRAGMHEWKKYKLQGTAKTLSSSIHRQFYSHSSFRLCEVFSFEIR